MVGTIKTEDNIKIFHTILDVFEDKDKKSSVQSYWDETKENWIDIVKVLDSPFEHVTSYATIGLSDFSIGKKVDDIPLGVEFVGSVGKKYVSFPNILSTCAYNIMIEHATCFPGIVYRNFVELYMPQSPMKHVLFVPPFGWSHEFETMHFKTKKVAWLMAIPISNNEFEYAKKNGEKQLEDLFEERQIDVYDLMRPSIL